MDCFTSFQIKTGKKRLELLFLILEINILPKLNYSPQKL